MNEVLNILKKNPLIFLLVVIFLGGGLAYLVINKGDLKVGGNMETGGGSVNNNSNNGGNQATSVSSVFGDVKSYIGSSNAENINKTDDLDIEGDIYNAKRCKPTPQKGEKYNKEAIVTLPQYLEIISQTKNGHFHLSAKGVTYSEQTPILVNGENVSPSEVAFRTPSIDIIVGCN